MDGLSYKRKKLVATMTYQVNIPKDIYLVDHCCHTYLEYIACLKKRTPQWNLRLSNDQNRTSHLEC